MWGYCWLGKRSNEEKGNNRNSNICIYSQLLLLTTRVSPLYDHAGKNSTPFCHHVSIKDNGANPYTHTNLHAHTPTLFNQDANSNIYSNYYTFQNPYPNPHPKS